MRRWRAQQIGASLIEALIALSVFSAGSLSLLSLQHRMQMRVLDAHQRHVLISTAYDLVARMHSTRSLAQPQGLLAKYQEMIGRFSATESATVRSRFHCPNERPASCELSGTTACSTEQRVQLDIWEVFCEPNTGIAAANGQEGLNNLGLSNQVNHLNVSMESASPGYRLQFKWQRKANAAVLGRKFRFAAAAVTKVQLCGETTEIDAAYDAFCIALD